MTDPRLWLGGIVLLVGVGLALGVFLLPHRTVPRRRRRWLETTARSPIERVSQASSELARRALGERSAGLGERLDLAGIKLRPQDFAVLVVAAAFVLGAGGTLLAGPIGGLLFALASLPGAALVVWFKTGRRRSAFAGQVDETLQGLAGSLRAGYSLPQAIATAAAETDEPTNAELSRVVNEARVGRPLVEALEGAAARMRNDDFYWVVQAIAINREVGGNLADVLEGVGHTIRERTHLRRQVEALAAEGKFSAIILVALPIVVGVLVSVLSPGYMSKLFTTPFGLLLLGVGAVLLLAGSLWMRVLIRIKY